MRKTPTKTKIICTLGPASKHKNTIEKMARAGMRVARINFSHGSHEEHQMLIDTIRAVNAKYDFHIKILQDLEGYRIRIGHMDRPMLVIKHQEMWLSSETYKGSEPHIPLDSDLDMDMFKKGMDVFVDDGKIHLKVLGKQGKRIKLEVIHGGTLQSRKGVNIPSLKLQANILTDKDRRDIEFGIKNQVDYIAQSFVRNKDDVVRVSKIANKLLPECKIIAKIENQNGVRNIDSIIQHSDGVMVARGDLGISVPIFRVPLIQKDIILRCNKEKKLVVTATQMLESMTENARPTRAEVSDVANAILDGTDYVMLSGETAAGAYPVKSVRMMQQIIAYTEKNRVLK